MTKSNKRVELAGQMGCVFVAMKLFIHIMVNSRFMFLRESSPLLEWVERTASQT